MDHQKGSESNQLFFTTLEEMVPQDSFARIIDLVVNNHPLKDLGFLNIY